MWVFAGRFAVILLLVGALSSAQAAPGEQRKQDLSVLKDQIRSLQDEIARGEESHDEVADKLSVSDMAVSMARRRLREISAQRSFVEQELDRLAQQRFDLEHTLAGARKSLGDAIFRTYVEGGQAGARRFLSGDEPNRLARDAYYLELIARQRLKLIEHARKALHDLSGVIAQTETRQAELLMLEREHARGQAALLLERKKQFQALSQVSVQLKAQRRQLQTLQKDEARIEKLLKGLERISRVPRSGKKNTGSVADSGSSEPAKPERAAPPETLASPDAVESSFGAQKGRLKWPVKGEFAGRFGATRAEGGATWKGVFIRALVGQDVRAVASGKVAFADWLRGFGNLMIVDHGDGYMTVYGNNEALYKSPGDDVHAGETIASVGASGGVDESGLYFEIRYRGQAQDPARWIAAK
jgi:septal ring factor EnvC (AmiA/AmiB activator)